MKQYAKRPDHRPRRVWEFYLPPPISKRWRISGYELDGKKGIICSIVMHCDEYIHGKNYDTCAMCGENHELPLPTDERYAYRWYPMTPTMRSIIQWSRRNSERGLVGSIEFYQEPYEQ